jgi:hypothetical protein
MQKKTDPERQGAVGHFRSIWQAAFFCQSALLFASCMGITLTPASQPAAPWPEPGHEVVYDFVTTPDEILRRRGSTTKQPVVTSIAVSEKMYVRRRVS